MTATAKAGAENAGARLLGRMHEHGPLCVGVDPHPRLLQDWGLADDAAGLERFAMTVLEAAAGHAASLKPQIALFERHGSSGIAVVEKLLAQAREAGIEVIADAKRGDIGSTMAGYAQAWLGEGSPLAADWVTLSPYLGFGSLSPALDAAASTGRGCFVLALTSNPEGAQVQHLGEPAVAGRILREAMAENRRRAPEDIGPCGLVVGATIGTAARDLGVDFSEFNGLILAPGFGAQGAGVKELREVFAGITDQVVVSSSRGVLRLGSQPRALTEEIRRLNEELREGLTGV